MSDGKPDLYENALIDDGKTRVRSKLYADEASLVEDGKSKIVSPETDETNILQSPKKRSKRGSKDTRQKARKSGKIAEKGFSILESPQNKKDSLTPQSSEKPEGDHLEPDDDGDQTLINVEIAESEPSGEDVDRTVLAHESQADNNLVLPSKVENDATILAVNEPQATFIATGNGISDNSNHGNSEAGRLLKNRFVLEEKIGSGGMGDVYKALDLRAQEAQERNPYIAIKILNENFARHRDAFISLQREHSKTRGIPHENIMAVYDFDREGDTVFMSMELLDGEPLDDYLKKFPDGVEENDAWKIIDGICKGLIRAHGAGIVHSDFKPGNIYYTGDQIAKVFDFGVARAVSNPEEIKSESDNTVFDAGTLGALTPTYASYEMLTGQNPSKSDDVFAAALVIYEIFTGKHPYSRVPADKAFEQGLEPEPISFLKSRQWRMLKKGLALKAEDRPETIEEFYDGMFSEEPPYLRYAAFSLIFVSLLGIGSYLFIQGSELDAQVKSKQLLLETNKERIDNRLKNATLDDFKSRTWHNDLKRELNSIQSVNEELVTQWEILEDPMVEKYENAVIGIYTSQIQELWELANSLGTDEANVIESLALLMEAESYMRTARGNYVVVSDLLRMQESSINSGIQLRELQLDTIQKNKTAEQRAFVRREAESKRNETYNTSTAELRSILNSCRQRERISEKDLGRTEGIIKTLKITHSSRYAKDKPGIVRAFGGCISQSIAKKYPDRARQVQVRVASIFPDEDLISSLRIQDKDPCSARNLVGSGNRGRGWCKDMLVSGGWGPELVVIPASGKQIEKKYAISRTEVKVSDYNKYCGLMGCKKLQGSQSIPATNISLEDAKNYAIWLSGQSDKAYRLPSVIEWSHAARTDKKQSLDANINCTVTSRGVKLGDKLLNSLSGKPNKWGLYNFVGNAQEWALDQGKVFAMGGGHTDPKGECTLDKKSPHTGRADPVTSFRLLREI